MIIWTQPYIYVIFTYYYRHYYSTTYLHYSTGNIRVVRGEIFEELKIDAYRFRDPIKNRHSPKALCVSQK